MTSIKRFFVSILLCTFLISLLPAQAIKAANPLSFIILTKYRVTMDIGDDTYIVALPSNGKKPTWRSSNSSIASVNTYGRVTAKKEGTAIITAKIKGSEASCEITVKKTIIKLNKTSASLERGATLSLTATTSNGSTVKWKSSKKSIATVDDNGKITALKPGETTITATADKTSVTCTLNVRRPTIKLNHTKITLYRGQTSRLIPKVSSGIAPSWKTNKKSVAVVDHEGNITAIKHGSALVTATVDGVSTRCEIIVKQPDITLSSTELSLKIGGKYTLSALVSSGNTPIWSTSNPNVALVDEAGNVSPLKKGRAYIYAAEDGIKVRCTIYVTE